MLKQRSNRTYIKEKIPSVWAPTYGAKYFIEDFKGTSTHLLPTHQNKEQIRESCKRYRNHVKSSAVCNVKNIMENKGLLRFKWPFSIKKPSFILRIHNASSYLISSLSNWYGGGIESFCSHRILSSASLFNIADGKLQAQ